jgi:hypothetical protein
VVVKTTTPNCLTLHLTRVIVSKFEKLKTIKIQRNHIIKFKIDWIIEGMSRFFFWQKNVHILNPPWRLKKRKKKKNQFGIFIKEWSFDMNKQDFNITVKRGRKFLMFLFYPTSAQKSSINIYRIFFSVTLH